MAKETEVSARELHQDHENIERNQRRQIRVDVIGWFGLVLVIAGMSMKYTAWADSEHKDNAEAISRVAQIVAELAVRVENNDETSTELADEVKKLREANAAMVPALERLTDELDQYETRLREQETGGR